MLLPVVTLLSGCATSRVPSDVAHLQLDRADSATVMVSKVGLDRKGGPLAVWGYVVKRITVKDTSGTHSDVSLFDNSGRVLRSSVEHFDPRQIPRRYRRPDYATYRIALDPLPEGTSRILVRAHDGPEGHL